MLGDLKQKLVEIDLKRVYTAAIALLIAGAAGHFMQRTSGGAPVSQEDGPSVAALDILSTPPEPAPAEVAEATPAPVLPEPVAETAPEAVAAADPVPPDPAPAEIATATPAPDSEPAPEPAPEPEAVAAADPAEPDPTPEIGETLAEARMAELIEDPVPAILPSHRPKRRPDIAPVFTGEKPGEQTAEKTGESMAGTDLLTTSGEKPIPAVATEAAVPGTTIYPAPKPDVALEEVTRAAADPLLTITEPAPERSKEAVFAAANNPTDLPSATTPAEPAPTACTIDMQATAQPAAMIAISLTAPCNAGETVGFEHAGLKFSEKLGPDGTLFVEMPAMTATAHVSARISGGEGKEIDITLPDFGAIDRIAVTWKGATGLQLHAMEGGASYGDAGHKWADTPGSAGEATAGKGGFISLLGNTASGYAADIYTYPASLTQQGMEPEVSIEAEVMENTCGTKIEGFILRTNPDRPPNTEPLAMAVPGCDAVGEYLVLKNLPVELKLAHR